jgi:hypothetical protein
MQVMPAGVGNFCVDCANTFLIPGALCDSEFAGVLFNQFVVDNLSAITRRGYSLKTEVNPNFTVTAGQIVGDFALQGYIPATASILDERSAFQVATDLARTPEAKLLFEVCNARPVYANGTANKRHPPQSFFVTIAGAEFRASAFGITRRNELAADSRHRVRMQSEFSTGPGAEFNQVEGGRPSNLAASLPPALRFALRGDAKIPDLIAGSCMSCQTTAGARSVFNPVLECKDHS